MATTIGGLTEMGRYMRMILMALVIFFGPAGTAFATTYYVATSGSDSNNGTSKSTPWAHLPGMATWTGSYKPVAGDTLVLRGCDDWANANFPITWTWSGTSSSPITINVDQTWYNTTNCPSAWNRPIFDGQGTAIQAPECTSGHRNYFIVSNSANYVTFDWIEMKGYYWNSDQQNTCWGDGGFFLANSSDYWTFNDFYVHDWNAGSSATDIDHMFGTSDTSPYCSHCLIENSVLDNSDGDQDSGVGVQFSSENNVYVDMVNAIKPFLVTYGVYSGNNISGLRESFDGQTHPNCIESVGAVSGSSTYYFFNNYIHGNTTCEGFQVGNPGETDYAWNNVWDMGAVETGGNNGPQVPQSSSGSNAFYFWNNTVRWGSGCMIAGGHSTSFATFVVQNNHCINDSSTVVQGTIAGAVISNNVGMTNAIATAEGYIASLTYALSPALACTLGTCQTLQAGVNLTSSWPAGFSTNDTTDACTEAVVGGVIQPQCPVRTPNSRPGAGAGNWDAGAYEFGSSSVSKPVATNGLKTVVD